MAVSKRLRFEILRRDNHACRYCGGVAPDVVITVDHVVPVSLGGSDDASNLVAACKDCNAGKASVPTGADLVSDVAQDAVRWANAMRASFDAQIEKLDKVHAYLAEFEEAWDGWTFNSGGKVPKPADWERSVTKWYGLGYPIAMLVDAIRGAMSKRNLKGYDPEFRYMAGIVWGTITEMEGQAAAMLASPPPAPVIHCGEWCSAHDSEEPDVCPKCNQGNCDWLCGYNAGDADGWNRLRSDYSFEIYQGNVLSGVCDFPGTELS